jgi:hypothetical protein
MHNIFIKMEFESLSRKCYTNCIQIKKYIFCFMYYAPKVKMYNATAFLISFTGCVCVCVCVKVRG